jgi:hypothetical protein
MKCGLGNDEVEPGRMYCYRDPQNGITKDINVCPLHMTEWIEEHYGISNMTKWLREYWDLGERDEGGTG